MSFSADDLRKLQIPLITLVASLVIAWLMTSAADSRELKATETLQTQQAALEKARQKNQSSGAEKENIVKYLPLYEGLVKRGFIGEEQRVNWISRIREINQHYKLFGVIYDIKAQEDYKPAFPLNVGNFKLHRSEVKLTFALLHENDLFTLFGALSNNTVVPRMLRDCTITRTNNTQLNKFVPNLNAVCTLDMLTLTEPKATP